VKTGSRGEESRDFDWFWAIWTYFDRKFFFFVGWPVRVSGSDLSLLFAYVRICAVNREKMSGREIPEFKQIEVNLTKFK
jgi:hypothetical protein